jgi:exonuclease VII small subunit
MSTTPRTDAFEIKAAHDAVEYGKTWQPMMFARQLETELAAAQQEAAHYMSVAQKATDELARLRAENERLRFDRLTLEGVTEMFKRSDARAEKAEAALQKIRDVMRQDSNGKDPMDAVEDIMHAAASETPARSK